MARPRGSKDADHEAKRQALLARMTVPLMRREPPRPSLRQLAEAAQVSVPTLRHYFGSRSDIVGAILAEYRRLGDARLKALEAPPAELAESVRQYALSLVEAVNAPRQVKLGDVFAVSMAEGLLDPQLGPAALGEILDPSVDALQRRLDVHVSRGEMIATDTRAAALMLLSPLLVAVLHQFQMGGQSCRPVDLHALAEEISAAFVRAYKAPGV